MFTRLSIAGPTVMQRPRRREPRRFGLAAGEKMSLVMAGNHCQGAEFRDGAHLITPQLESAIDAIAQQTPGMYFGRFDLRYHDVEQLKAGGGFKIVELNGVTGVSTNLYDSDFSLLRSYTIVYRQWKTAFEIGRANRIAGTHAYSTWQLVRMTWAYRRLRTKNIGAD